MAEVSPYVVGVALPKDAEELMYYVLVMTLIYMTLLTLEKARMILPPLPTFWQVISLLLLTALILTAVTVYHFSSHTLALYTSVKAEVSEFIHPHSPSSSSPWTSFFFSSPSSRREL